MVYFILRFVVVTLALVYSTEVETSVYSISVILRINFVIIGNNMNGIEDFI